MFLIRVAKRLYHHIERIKQRRDEIQPRGRELEVDRAVTADRRRQGFSFRDSFCYDLKYNNYRDYISTWEACQPAKSGSPYLKIMSDKYLFSCVFAPYITVPPTYALIENGQIMDIGGQGVDLYDRLQKCGGAFIKDRFGCGGFNVIELRAGDDGLYHRNRLITREALPDIIKSFSRGIIQGRLRQGKFEDNIFCESVNTVRVISMRKRDSLEHEVVGAVHRFGTKRSAPVDNFRQGGTCALIDIKTGRMGKLASMFATDENGRHLFRTNHPDTEVQVEGGY